MNTIGMLSTLQNAISVSPEKTNVSATGRIVSAAAGLLLGYAAIKSFKRGGFSLLIPAGYLLYRGASGYCYLSDLAGVNSTSSAESVPFELSTVITVRERKDVVYRFWRKLENLPQVMKHLKKVEKVGDKRYRWDAEFTKVQYSWLADITEDVVNERISWRAVESADVENWGTVEFREVAQGTEIKVNLVYKPAKTKIGNSIATMLDPVFKQMVEEDLRNFKRLMETPKTVQ